MKLFWVPSQIYCECGSAAFIDASGAEKGYIMVACQSMECDDMGIVKLVKIPPIEFKAVPKGKAALAVALANFDVGETEAAAQQAAKEQEEKALRSDRQLRALR